MGHCQTMMWSPLTDRDLVPFVFLGFLHRPLNIWKNTPGSPDLSFLKPFPCCFVLTGFAKRVYISAKPTWITKSIWVDAFLNSYFLLRFTYLYPWPSKKKKWNETNIRWLYSADLSHYSLMKGLDNLIISVVTWLIGSTEKKTTSLTIRLCFSGISLDKCDQYQWIQSDNYTAGLIPICVRWISVFGWRSDEWQLNNLPKLLARTNTKEGY